MIVTRFSSPSTQVPSSRSDRSDAILLTRSCSCAAISNISSSRTFQQVRDIWTANRFRCAVPCPALNGSCATSCDGHGHTTQTPLTITQAPINAPTPIDTHHTHTQSHTNTHPYTAPPPSPNPHICRLLACFSIRLDGQIGHPSDTPRRHQRLIH